MEMSLWGDEFAIKEDDVKLVLKKSRSSSEKKPKKSESQMIKSKIIPISDKLRIIEENVHRILGDFEKDTIVIRDYEEFSKYIDIAIENGIISIDTETNNSLDTIQCKIMGLCLYTPGQKDVYIPVNHVNFEITDDNRIIELDKLDNQITEQQIGVQLQRLVNSNTKCIFTNAPFDIEVIYSTCGTMLNAFWDTFSAAKVLDENELAGLKPQYRLHINSDQEKYDIEHLFKGLPYSIFKPELFALYAATDSRMTYEVYLYQLDQFNKPENKDIYDLFKNIEMPILKVIVGMELRGVTVDVDYARAMSVEYHKKSNDIQHKIDSKLELLKGDIDKWKLSTEANTQRKVYLPKKTKLSEKDISEKYPYTEKDGRRYKFSSKTPAQQLSDPIDLGSPTQLQILLYDILKVPSVNKEDPRGTGADILEELSETYHIEICDLLIQKRGVDILINTFIDKMPELIRKKTNKLHAKFNSYGAATGRFSSADPNLQNIPSKSKEIRMIFTPGIEYKDTYNEDDIYKVRSYDDVMLDNDIWKRASELSAGDKILTSDNTYDEIKAIKLVGDYYYLYV